MCDHVPRDGCRLWCHDKDVGESPYENAVRQPQTRPRNVGFTSQSLFAGGVTRNGHGVRAAERESNMEVTANQHGVWRLSLQALAIPHAEPCATVANTRKTIQDALYILPSHRSAHRSVGEALALQKQPRSVCVYLFSCTCLLCGQRARYWVVQLSQCNCVCANQNRP